MSLAVSTSPSKMSESFLPPAEVEELQEELDTLKADNTYVEFVEAVVTGKDVPLESDSEDPLYPDPASERQGTKSPEEGAKSGEDESGFQDAEEGDGSGSDSDDTLADEEDEEEEEAVEDESVEGGAAAVPARMKIEANKRYPPFWKTKMKLKAATDAAPEDEDAADADYCPPAEEEDDENSALDAARRAKGDANSDEDSDSDGEDEIEMSEDEPKGPIDDNDDVMRELRAGLDEMHVVQEEVTREEQEAGAKGNILKEITSFDDSTYDESADADYAPPADIDEIIEAQAEEDEEKLEQGEEEEEEGSDEEQMETEV